MQNILFISSISFVVSLKHGLTLQLLQDIDCMPIKPLDNLPTSLARNEVGIDKFFENLNELKTNGPAKDQKPEEYKKPSHGENLEHLDVPSNVSPSTYPMSNLLKQAKVRDP